MNKFIAKELSDVNKKVREAQVQLIFRQTWTGLAGVLIVALTACAVFWQIIPHWKLSLWAGLTILLTLIRGGIIYAFQKREPFSTDINRWATLHVIGVTLSALLWAIPSIFLWPKEFSIFQLVWPIFILPLSAAAVATYYTWKSSYISFVLITVIPISVRFFFEGGFLFNMMGFLALFFIAVLVRAGKVMHINSVKAFKFGISNESLNINLKKEIAERTLAEVEKEKLIKELQAVVEKMKNLEGVIPICMHCKGIRNNEGSWSKLEEYITEHSDAKFSHGICDDCLKKHYPKFQEEKEEQN